MYLRVLFNAFSNELTLEDKFNMHLSCNKTPSQQHNLDHVIDVREEEETCAQLFFLFPFGKFTDIKCDKCAPKSPLHFFSIFKEVMKIMLFYLHCITTDIVSKSHTFIHTYSQSFMCVIKKQKS